MKHGSGGAIKKGMAPNSNKVPSTKDANGQVRTVRGKSFGGEREMRKHTPHGASDVGAVK